MHVVDWHVDVLIACMERAVTSNLFPMNVRVGTWGEHVDWVGASSVRFMSAGRSRAFRFVGHVRVVGESWFHTLCETMCGAARARR